MFVVREYYRDTASTNNKDGSRLCTCTIYGIHKEYYMHVIPGLSIRNANTNREHISSVNDAVLVLWLNTAMSSARGLVLFITLAISLTVVQCWGWRWNVGWSTEEPANCPHENHETHICSTLQSVNATCITIKCCSAFRDDEEYDEYDSREDSNEEDDNIYYLGRPTEDSCRLCYTSKPCSVYQCYRRCCDGYEEDEYGRCQNETGHLQCQNGGSPYQSHYGSDMCMCPQCFFGTSCEIPASCLNGGECVVKDNQERCNCSHGYHGTLCEKSGCTMKCKNGGQCYKDGIREFCQCPAKYAGKQCEELFTQPDTCPVPEYEHQYCSAECTGNMDCKGEHVCCREGCTTICREPKTGHCMSGDRQFDIYESHNPDPCTTCTCEQSGRMACSTRTCAIPLCKYGNPERKPDQCCMSCPDTPPANPPGIVCPTSVLYLKTNYYTDEASINSVTTNIRAFNSQHIALPVKYSQPHVRHCHCDKRPEVVVNAYATDADGNVATCTFKVIVLDNQPPIFRSCPEDIYVFDNEVVQWKDPIHKDNVGIAHESSTHTMNDKFPVGVGIRTPVRYEIRDYDQNTAFCDFFVSVTPADTDFADLPQGLKDRSTGAVSMIRIICACLGVLALIGVLILLFCCKRQQLARANRNAHGATTKPAAYDNDIYATVDNIDVKLPPYSTVPMNPPPYNITDFNKDVTYISLQPPSYTNPGYETVNPAFATLNVHVPKPAKSVTSEK